MTTIRRINVSQIDGNDANANATDEVRPFGEVGFFIDTNANPNKLVMLMFDGLRTHVKSKVLGPGILYGSNANSADQSGLDTIRLVPDSELYNNNNTDQYIIIEPTFPNHIHIRAGGSQDNSIADLFLGGETSHFRVLSGSNPPVNIAANGNTWQFSADGSMLFPNGGSVRISPAPVTSKGSVNDKVGTIAFDSSYFYYCTADYVDGVADIWKRVAWSGDTW
jgi:hypothetical protein